MLMGTLVSGKQYTSVEYFCALALAGGISLFAQKVSACQLLGTPLTGALQRCLCPKIHVQGSTKVLSKLHTPNAPLGYFLCLTNLVFDGYTNAAQVRTRPPYCARCMHGIVQI